MPLKSHKELIHRWVDAWTRMDLSAFDELFAPDYSVNDTFVGVQGVKQAVQYLQAAFSPVSLTLDDLIAEGDKIVVRRTMRGTHAGDFMGIAASGRQATLTGINIYRIADGRIVENHEQVGVDALLKQLQ